MIISQMMNLPTERPSNYKEPERTEVRITEAAQSGAILAKLKKFVRTWLQDRYQSRGNIQGVPSNPNKVAISPHPVFILDHSYDPEKVRQLADIDDMVQSIKRRLAIDEHERQMLRLRDAA